METLMEDTKSVVKENVQFQYPDKSLFIMLFGIFGLSDSDAKAKIKKINQKLNYEFIAID